MACRAGNVGGMTDPDDARIAAALEKATEAFWATFVAEFPEVTTGDLDPLSAVAFDGSVERAAREWLRLNGAEAAA